MARAHSIWIVVRDDEPVPVGAFTVKHEMVTWFERDILPWNRDFYDIWKLPDGKPVEAPAYPARKPELIGKWSAL